MTSRTDPFFQDNADISVESRNSKGEPGFIESRNSFQSLKIAAQKAVVGLMLATSMTGALAGTVGDLSNAQPLNSPAVASVVFKGERAEEAFAKISPSIQKYISSFELTKEKLSDFEHSGPVSTSVSVSNDKSTCSISLLKVDSLLSSQAKLAGSNHQSTEAQKILFTDHVERHEVAHCEFMIAARHVVASPLGDKIANAIHYSENLKYNNDIPTGYSVNINELMLERHADSVSTLQLASKVFEGKSTHSEIKESLEDFNEGMKVAMQLRRDEMTGVLNSEMRYNDHDTMPVLVAVNKMVHDAARTPEAMENFKANVLSGDNLSMKAVDLSLGSIRSELKDIHENQLADAIKAAGKLAPEKVAGLESLKGNFEKISLKDKDFGDELEAIYKNSDKAYAMTKVDTVRADMASALTSNLLKTLGSGGQESPTKSLRIGM